MKRHHRKTFPDGSSNKNEFVAMLRKRSICAGDFWPVFAVLLLILLPVPSEAFGGILTPKMSLRRRVPPSTPQQQQQQQQQPHLWNGVNNLATTTIDGAAISKVNDANNGKSKNREAIPFLIERLPNRPNPNIFPEIASMCIAAFFNDNCDGANESDLKIPVWKEWQLAYLRKLQTADLERRRRRDSSSNIMFVARRVVPATLQSARKAPLILDFSSVFNFNSNLMGVDKDYVSGEIVGFVEVTQRRYGLGDNNDNSNHDNEESNTRIPHRPVLTNLSVRKEARGAGVGTELVAACERVVVSQWNLPEIVLEVEEDNYAALNFYQNRGYDLVSTDPASRRYVTTGLWLQQVRCKRLVMRKDLNSDIVSSAAAAAEGTMSIGLQVLQKLRDNIMLSITDFR